MPAAEISEQILRREQGLRHQQHEIAMLNGAVPGTYDGANIEIVEQAGEDNNYIFGARIEIEKIRESTTPLSLPKQSPAAPSSGFLVDGTFSDGGTGMFRELYDALLKGASWHQPDHYFLLKDFDSYRRPACGANQGIRIRSFSTAKCYLNMANAETSAATGRSASIMKSGRTGKGPQAQAAKNGSQAYRKDENTRRFSGGSCLKKSAGCLMSRRFFHRGLWYNNRRAGEAEDFRRLSSMGAKQNGFAIPCRTESAFAAYRGIIVCVPKGFMPPFPCFYMRRQA